MTGPTKGDNIFWCRLYENKQCEDLSPEGKMVAGYKSVWTHMLDPGVLEWNSEWVYAAYMCQNGK